MTESESITSKAKSNLAFTLMNLPEDRRRHMAQFYAFCRIVDDIVDEPGIDADERHAALDRWLGVITGTVEPTPGIEQEVHALVQEVQLDVGPMRELIAGCRSDIEQVQPATRRELLAYAYKVAACVGITSATVMGASPAARDYAVALGYALQLVNILRDVAEDIDKYGRIYLPKDDMELFGVTPQELMEKRCSGRVRRLLEYEAVLAERYFDEAEMLYQELSPEDRAALIPAQAMSLIYHTILEKMHDDEYRVLERRYAVGNFRKLWFLLRARMGTVELPLPSLADWAFFKGGDDKKDNV